MGKYPIYAIMALTFIGIIKLLQVTAFDADRHKKNQEVSFSKSIEPKKTDFEKGEKTENIKFNPTDPESQASEDTTPPTLDSLATDSIDTTTKFVENDGFEDEKPAITETNTANSGNSLADLKNNYLSPIIAKLSAGQLREDVVIRYYRHDQDGDKIYSLKNLGYYIHEKEANETVGQGSNVLYYGDGVAIEDIQIVAYTLLEKGLPIKAIEKTQFTWKSNSIEIGTNLELVDATNLTPTGVANFKK